MWLEMIVGTSREGGQQSRSWRVLKLIFISLKKKAQITKYGKTLRYVQYGWLNICRWLFCYFMSFLQVDRSIALKKLKYYQFTDWLMG